MINWLRGLMSPKVEEKRGLVKDKEIHKKIDELVAEVRSEDVSPKEIVEEKAAPAKNKVRKRVVGLAERRAGSRLVEAAEKRAPEWWMIERAVEDMMDYHKKEWDELGQWHIRNYVRKATGKVLSKEELDKLGEKFNG